MFVLLDFELPLAQDEVGSWGRSCRLEAGDGIVEIRLSIGRSGKI